MFLKSMLFIVSANVGVQLMNLIFMPVITRLYTPEHMGAAGMLIAIASILAPISTLSYSIAISLGSNKKEVQNLACLTILIILTFTLLTTTIITLLDKISIITSPSNYTISYIILITLLLTQMATIQVYRSWLIKEQFTKQLAVSIFLAAIVLNILKLSFGVTFATATNLILSTLISQSVLIITLHKKIIAKTHSKMTLSIKVGWALLIKYKELAFFKTPQIALSAVIQSGLTIVLGVLYGIELTGMYVLAKSVVSLPSAVIGRAVGEVLLPKFSQLLKEEKQCKPIFYKSTFLLFAMLMPFATVIYFYGETMFQFFFGPEWEKAGEIASIIVVGVIFTTANRPAVMLISALNIERTYLKYEAFQLIMLSFVVLITHYTHNSHISVLWSASILAIIFNTILCIYVSRKL